MDKQSEDKKIKWDTTTIPHQSKVHEDPPSTRNASDGQESTTSDGKADQPTDTRQVVATGQNDPQNNVGVPHTIIKPRNPDERQVATGQNDPQNNVGVPHTIIKPRNPEERQVATGQNDPQNKVGVPHTIIKPSLPDERQVATGQNDPPNNVGVPHSTIKPSHPDARQVATGQNDPPNNVGVPHTTVSPHNSDTDDSFQAELLSNMIAERETKRNPARRLATSWKTLTALKTQYNKKSTVRPTPKHYVGKVLDLAEGGYNDFLPSWAFPSVQVRPVIHIKKNDDDGAGKEDIEKRFLPDTFDALNAHMAKCVLSQFQHFSLTSVYHLAQMGEFSARLFRDKKLINLLVHVKEKTFYGHKHVLACHSHFFHQILARNNLPPDIITDVTLKKVEPNNFKDFLHYAYFGEIELTEKRVPPLLDLCTKLGANQMRARIHMYVATYGELHPNLVKRILTGSNTNDRSLAIMEAIDKFEMFTDDPDYLGRLNYNDILEILSSDELNVKSELDVFWAVVIWVAEDLIGRFHLMDKLICTVRFTCMSTLQLVDISRATNIVGMTKDCKQHIMRATWVCHAREMGMQDPLSIPMEKPRKRLIAQPPYAPSTDEFDKRYNQYRKRIAHLDIATLSKRGTMKVGVKFADETGGELEVIHATAEGKGPKRADAQSARELKLAEAIHKYSELYETLRPVSPHSSGSTAAKVPFQDKVEGRKKKKKNLLKAQPIKK